MRGRLPSIVVEVDRHLGVQRILTMMKQKEIGAVIVTKLDCLTRLVKDLTEIIELANKKGIAPISVNEQIDTGTAAGRMIPSLAWSYFKNGKGMHERTC